MYGQGQQQQQQQPFNYPNQPPNLVGSTSVNIPTSPFPTPFPSGTNQYPQGQFAQQPFPVGGSPSNRLFTDLGGANMPGGALTQIGLEYGSQMFGQHSNEAYQRYNQNFAMLKYYFNVNNSYVINKLKLLLFPLRHKVWKRRIQRQGEGEVYLPPRDDINAPDLYIPLMAFVTYVLMIGFVMGASFKFTPEVLGITASSGLAVLAFEVIIIKFGFYLLNSLTVPILDVIAYCGYKYVGIVITIIGGLLVGHLAYIVLMLLTSIFMAIFMVKTLRLVFPDRGDSSFGTHNTRNYFLVGLGALQLVLQYYLSYDISKLN